MKNGTTKAMIALAIIGLGLIGFIVITLINNPEMLPHDNDKIEYGSDIIIYDDTYDNRVKSIVDQLIPKESNLMSFDKYKILHDWTCSYLDYNYDALNDMDLLRKCNDPEYCLDTGWAVCGGYANLYKDLCDAANLNCSYIDGYASLFQSDKSIGHAWNYVEMDGKFYHLDVCWDDVNGTQYSWFMQGSGYVTNSFREWQDNINFSVESYPLTRSNMEPYTFKTTVVK